MYGLLRKYKISKIIDDDTIKLSEQELDICNYLNIIFSDLVIYKNEGSDDYMDKNDMIVFAYVYSIKRVFINKKVYSIPSYLTKNDLIILFKQWILDLYDIEIIGVML